MCVLLLMFLTVSKSTLAVPPVKMFLHMPGHVKRSAIGWRAHVTYALASERLSRLEQ